MVNHSFSTATRFSAQLRAFRAADALRDDRFPARNFTLECTLPSERIASYVPDGDIDLVGGSQHDRLGAWNAHHDRYLNAHVRAGWRGEQLELSDPSAPETFRARNALDEYGYVDDAVDLVRIESIRRIARSVGADPVQLRALAEDAATERRSVGVSNAPSAAMVDSILRVWQQGSDMDNRPMFASFWEYASSVLADPVDGWANEMRDRLGLTHIDPRLRLAPDGIDVIAFRYPIRMVHRPDRKGRRLIARPTVLDGALSRSFCTFPAGSGRGCALDLAARTEEPWQEVIHPAVTLQARHVWAVGTVTAPAAAELELARWTHYQEVRGLVDDDLGALIDEIEDEPQ